MPRNSKFPSRPTHSTGHGKAEFGPSSSDAPVFAWEPPVVPMSQTSSGPDTRADQTAVDCLRAGSQHTHETLATDL